MSYLNNLRLAFSGDFQADVSTVNNDVRHFDNATFQSRFQDFQTRTDANGWWNPIGSGAFRLIDCQIQSVSYEDGTTATDSSLDPAIGLFISGSNDRAGGKIVDLDPQWQLASQLWGLQVRLTQPNGHSPLSGAFEPAAFRDLWFSRLSGGAPGDSGGSSIFQSVLTDLSWDHDLLKSLDSPFLTQLQAASKTGLLSIRLTTFGYNLSRSSDRFTVGTVSGVIGPYQPSEPRSFILGRRMVPLNGSTTSSNITFFNCQVVRDSCTVLADFSNALPLKSASGSLANVGTLQLAMLTSEDTLENDRVTRGSDFIPLGDPIPYLNQNWLLQTSGVWAVKIPLKLFFKIGRFPLALIQLEESGDGISNNGMVVIRESDRGMMVRADQFVRRTESGSTAQTTLYAAQYGKPLPNATIDISLQPPNPGTAGAPPSQNPPTAEVYNINTPPTAVSFSPTLTTNASDSAILEVKTSDPGNPRHYIDGQIYIFEYQFPDQAPRQQQSFDQIFMHLYDPYPVPDQPTWVEHIHPILQQYGNLYPIMSKQLFDLGDYEAVKQNRALLELAFSLDRSNSNHMPVTRDLSAPKQATILKWLRQKNPDGTYALVYGEAAPSAPVQPAAIAAAAAPSPAPSSDRMEEMGSKTLASRTFRANRRAARRS